MFRDHGERFFRSLDGFVAQGLSQRGLASDTMHYIGINIPPPGHLTCTLFTEDGQEIFKAVGDDVPDAIAIMNATMSLVEDMLSHHEVDGMNALDSAMATGGIGGIALLAIPPRDDQSGLVVPLMFQADPVPAAH